MGLPLVYPGFPKAAPLVILDKLGRMFAHVAELCLLGFQWVPSHPNASGDQLGLKSVYVSCHSGRTGTSWASDVYDWSQASVHEIQFEARTRVACPRVS